MDIYLLQLHNVQNVAGETTQVNHKLQACGFT